MAWRFRRVHGMALLAFTAAWSLGSPLYAQEADAVKTRPWRVRMGTIVPTDDETRHYVGGALYSLGVSYDLPIDKSPYSAYRLSVYADVMRGTHVRTFPHPPNQLGGRSPQDTRLTIFGLGIAERYEFGRRSASLRPYGSLGIGFYVGNGIVDIGDSGFFHYNKTTTGAGGKLLVGVETRFGGFLELGYHVLPPVGAVTIPGQPPLKASGFDARIGYYF